LEIPAKRQGGRQPLAYRTCSRAVRPARGQHHPGRKPSPTGRQAKEDKMEKKMRFLSGGSHCYECGKPFPTEHLLAEADAHEAEFPGFRRASTSCPVHNYGATVVFERDCEF